MDLIEKITFTNIMLNDTLIVNNSIDANRIFLDFCIFFINDNIRSEDISIDEIQVNFVLNEEFDKTIKSLCEDDEERYNLFLFNIKKILYYGYLKVFKKIWKES